MRNLIDMLTRAAATAPEKVAVIDESGTLTFAELAGAARGVAGQVAALAAEPRVGVLLPSGRGFAISFFGALLAGRTPVPLNLLLKPAELAFCARDAGLDLVLTAAPLAQAAGQLANTVVSIDRPPSAKVSEIPAAPDALGPADPAPGDIAIVLYTSGTTAVPKGVMLTHANLLANAEAGCRALGLTADHRVLGLLPLFHSFGLMCSLVIPVYLGACTLLVARFQPASVLEMMRSHGPTAMFAVAGMYGALVRSGALASMDLSGLQFAIAGGEALPERIRLAFEQQTGRPLLEGYGLTETSPVVSVNRPDAARPGTTGHPLPGVRVRLVDEVGRDVPPDADGEVWISGPSVMPGYFNRPDETAQALTDDGWFRTGDIGRLDETGALAITGRLKDLIICGGENIAPREIEDILTQHPTVVEAAVIGVPDPVRGEVPKAYVVLTEGGGASDHELCAFCRRRLARFKVPRQVEFRDALPKGLTGKIDRRALREEQPPANPA